MSFCVCFYISGHGFGHAARDVEIINALVRLEPSTQVFVRTTVPQWFLDATLDTPVERIDGPTDTGVVQPDSLSVDEDETARCAAAFYCGFATHVARERDLLERLDADLVIGDIPPLAFAAAAAARVRSIALGNFTWDWIYAGYPHFETRAPGVCRLIADANALATLTLRMPFAGGFEAMAPIEDVPLVARHASHDRAHTRRRLALDDGRPIVLATFGGHGRAIPLEPAAARAAFTIVATEYEVRGTATVPNLRVFAAGELRAAGITYTDLLAASDVVATKLGYGIVSECLANDVPLLYTTRGGFREQEVFQREMPAVMRCACISREQLTAGDWAEGIDRLLAQPAPARRMPSNGADVVARRILDFVPA